MSDALRTALLELGDVPPPPDLAGGALARARRDRRRGVAVAGFAAVLTAAAVVVPVTVLGRPEPTPPAAALTPRFLVAGFASRDPGETTFGRGSYRVYRRSGYLTTPWRAAVPSPDGRTVAVTAPDGKVGIVSADRVGDPAAVRWIPGLPRAQGSVWSPDSRRLYVSGYLKIDVQSGDLMVVGDVVDARTLSRREVRVSSPQADGKTVQVVFSHDGKGLTLAPGVATGEIPESGTSGLLQIRGGGGSVVTLSVRPAAVPDQPFSPNGQLFASFLAGRTRVIDLASGAELGAADGEVVGWYDDGRYVVRAGTAIRLVDLASGRVLAERDLAAAGRELTAVWLAPLHGPPPPGAIVL
jgi:hypothetical protein